MADGSMSLSLADELAALRREVAELRAFKAANEASTARICYKRQAFNLTELVTAIHNGAHGFGFKMHRDGLSIHGCYLTAYDRETGNEWSIRVQPRRKLAIAICRVTSPDAAA